MTPEPLVCTEDPARGTDRIDDFRTLLRKARSVERPTPQHLRMAMVTDGGLDISVLAHEMQCCSWFDFHLTPTAEGTVILDIEVPANTGPVRGPAPELHGTGSPEEILDTFAQAAAAGIDREEGDREDPGLAAHQCDCC